MNGYKEMLRRIEPEKIICYHEPFPEMEGDIVYVNYERSSWMHMDDDIVMHYDKYTGNHQTTDKSLPCKAQDCSELQKQDVGYIITKQGYILSHYDEKGMGSAYGGKWRPKKEEDERLWGTPGEIKETYIKGYRILTKIGKDGRAVRERHCTDHNRPKFHSNPHDHLIAWDKNNDSPIFHKPNNYWDENPPVFKENKGVNKMNDDNIHIQISPDRNKFNTIDEFKWCMYYGGEVGFWWEEKYYFISACLKQDKYCFSPDSTGENDIYYDTVEQLLNHIISGKKLREIIKYIEVVDRPI